MFWRDSWAVAKKDLMACLKDKVILMQILILPFVVVFGYAMLMSAMNGANQTSTKDDMKAYYVNAPEQFAAVLTDTGYRLAQESEIDRIKEEIQQKKTDLLIVFPKDFKLKQGSSDTENAAALDNIGLWYNSEKTSSQMRFSEANILLNEFQPKAFTINADTAETYNFGDEDFMLKNVLGMIFPIMVLMSVFMICMNLAAQSIAGDKERGFMNTLLITPVKRTSIAVGKSLCIFITAILGGLSAFIGMALSLPQLAKTFGSEEGFAFSFSDYFVLFAVTITAVFVLVGILLIVSTLAKDIKQATTIAPIFMLILMVAGMLTMSDNIRELIDNFGIYHYLIPAWNTMRIMQEIIAMKYDGVCVLITCGVNLVVTVVMIAAVGKLFNRESMLMDS